MKISNHGQKAQKLLDFLKSYELKLIADNGDINSESSEARFINWLRVRNIAIDPLATGQIKVLIKKFERRGGEPEEDESYAYDELLWKLEFLDKDFLLYDQHRH